MNSDVTRRSFLGAAGTVAATGTVAGTIEARAAAAAAPAGSIKILGIGCSPRGQSTTEPQRQEES